MMAGWVDYLAGKRQMQLNFLAHALSYSSELDEAKCSFVVLWNRSNNKCDTVL